jgi:hypothetical protein
MAKFIFKYEEDSVREAKKVELDVPDDMNITEFKTVCIRMAHTLGYSSNSVERVFGPIETSQTKEESITKFLAFINENKQTTTHQFTGSII